MIQRTTPQQHLGKVFGFISTLSNGLTPAAQGFTGFIANYIAIPIIYLASSIAAVFAGLKFAVSKSMVSWLLNNTGSTATIE